MSRIDDLIRELCPTGIQNHNLDEIVRFEKGEHLSEASYQPGVFPVVTASRSESRRHAHFNVESNAVTVTSHGAYAGHVNFWSEPIWLAGNVFLLKPNRELVTEKYLFYALKNSEELIQGKARGGGIPYMNSSDLKTIKFPVPPLEVQREIVSILDKFTQLEAELEAELEARRVQYEVTRDRLLDFSSDLSAHPIGELIRELCPEGVSSFRIGDVLTRRKGIQITAGKMKTLARGDAQVRVFAGGQTLVDVDSAQFPRGRLISEPGIIVKSRGHVEFAYWESLYTHKSEIWSYTKGADDVDLKYVYYLLKSRTKFFQELARSKSVKMPQLSVGDTDDFTILVPPLEVQKEIVSILDKLDSLVNDISFGLPAEIAARRIQYEYYRDKLLTFKGLDAA